MKRKLLFAILGVSVAATAFGAGAIYVNNVWPDSHGIYYPVVWDPAVLAAHRRDTMAVLSTDGVQLNVWYGRGAGLTADQLQVGPAVPLNTMIESWGYYGYYGNSLVVLNDWVPGDTFTFQLRASGISIYGAVDTFRSRSALWQENANILDLAALPPYELNWYPAQPGVSLGMSPIVYIPEPSAIALIGLGMAALVTLRRRS